MGHQNEIYKGKIFIRETYYNVCLHASFSHENDMGFSCFTVFHMFLKIYKDLRYKLHVLGFIIHMRILNGWDHELETHKRAGQIYGWGVFHTFLKIYEDLNMQLNVLGFISSIKSLNG